MGGQRRRKEADAGKEQRAESRREEGAADLSQKQQDRRDTAGGKEKGSDKLDIFFTSEKRMDHTVICS